MTKSHVVQREPRRKPQLTMKEKRAQRRARKSGQQLARAIHESAE